MECANCNKAVEDGAQCKLCKSYYDFKCAHITKTAYRAMDGRKNWKCSVCRDNMLEGLIVKFSALGQQSAFQDCQLETVQAIVKDIKCSCEETSEKLYSIEARLSALEADSASFAYQVTHIQELAISKDQWTRINNVEIKGVPVKRHENLFDIIAKIGDVVGYAVPKNALSYVFRIPTRNCKEKTIIATFVNRYEKEGFVAAARAKKVLIAQEIGFPSKDNRVYVNDHLCPDYKILLNETKALAKERGYLYVWVKFAKIHVRRDDQSKTIIINTNFDLHKIH